MNHEPMPAQGPVDVTVGRLRMIQYLRLIHAAYDADGNDLSAWAAKAADELERLANEGSDAWKEAAIGWTVCASVHEGWAKGKDALYTTRHADFERHADDARQRHALLTPSAKVSGAGTASAGLPG